MTRDAIEARKRSGYPFQDPENRLACDQRELWWRNYTTCKAAEPEEMPVTLKAKEVADLSVEPPSPCSSAFRPTNGDEVVALAA